MWVNIATIWAVALLCGWLLRTFIPSGYGVFSMGKDVARVFDLNRIAFWLCVFVAIGLSIGPAVKAFMQDFPFWHR